MLQLNETIPYVSMDYIKRRSRRNGRIIAVGSRHKFVGLVRDTLKRSVKRALSNNADKFWVLRNVMWKSTELPRRIIASHNDAGPFTLSYVEGHGVKSQKKRRQCNWWCAACCGQCDWREANRVLTISKLQAGGHRDVQTRTHRPGSMRHHEQCFEALHQACRRRRTSSMSLMMGFRRAAGER